MNLIDLLILDKDYIDYHDNLLMNYHMILCLNMMDMNGLFVGNEG